VKAVRWHGRRDVRLDDVQDAPPPRAGEIRIDVLWCGICGTDLKEYRSGPIVIPTEPHPLTGLSAPVILGHEVSGRVTDIGEGVDDLHEGDLVALDGLIYCGSCPACRRHEVNRCERLASIGFSYHGGLAERMTVPASMAIAAPATVQADSLALAEPFSVAVRALRRGRLQPGDRVLVFGAGTIGLAVVQVAKALGAESVMVCEPIAFRRELAVSIGATAAAEPERIRELVARGSRGPDIVVECTGSATVPELASELVRSGGRVVLVGVFTEAGPLSFLGLVLREIELIGSVSHIYDEDFLNAVELISSEKVDALRLVTHRVPLADAVHKGIHALGGPDVGSVVKILVSPEI